MSAAPEHFYVRVQVRKNKIACYFILMNVAPEHLYVRVQTRKDIINLFISLFLILS